MITRAYEFEVFQDEGLYVAIPYDLKGGTQGRDFEELCTMVADWMRIHLEHFDMHDIEPPKPSYGNRPRHGGTNMLVCATAGRETVAKMTGAEAAERLGITPSRISQLVSSHQLDGWKEGRNIWVTISSVEARLKEKPRPGRPRKHPHPAGAEIDPAANENARGTTNPATSKRPLGPAVA